MNFDFSEEQKLLQNEAKKFLAENSSLAAMRDILENDDVSPVRLPPRSPNLNAHLERFFGSLKSECLDRMIFFGEKSLRRAVHCYLEHYHAERNHQGVANQILEAGNEVGRSDGKIECRERLGGLVRYYHRQAA